MATETSGPPYCEEHREQLQRHAGEFSRLRLRLDVAVFLLLVILARPELQAYVLPFVGKALGAGR